MDEIPTLEQAKIVGLGAAVVAVAGFWAVLLMAPVQQPPASVPVVEQTANIGALP